MSRSHLRFDAYFDDAADDGEDVADDEEDIPAVNKFQTICHVHFAIESLLEELHELLKHIQRRKGTVRPMSQIWL